MEVKSEGGICSIVEEEINKRMQIVREVEGFELWMIHWIFWECLEQCYKVYDPANDLICATPHAKLAVDSFNYSTFGKED